jgi:hypothetical protein
VGKSTGTDLFIRDAGEVSRMGKPAAGKQFFEAGENGARRLAVKLLMGDGPHQGLKRGTPRLGRQGAPAMLLDQRAHHRVLFR